MEQIQKNISTFIQSQFPDEYRDGGPVFIEFVKAYYEWMESSQVVDNVKNIIGTISVQAQNNIVVGTNTSFTTDLSNNQTIAVWKNNSRYQLFTINAIADDLTFTINELPDFSNNVTVYANTQVQFNPTYYQRRLLEFADVDDTTDQFLAYFKSTYLKDIQFDIKSDVRLLLKHTLDLYRAKGTPQAVALLFRIVFGTGMEVYYPGDDIFKLSDGIWKKPRYLEISLGNAAEQFVGKQVIGETSKSTAFAEKLVRRKINDRFIDVLYVTNILGTFTLGEKVNTENNPIAIANCPIVIGSLTELDVDVNGVGQGFIVGDLVDVYSANGGEAIARVSDTTNISGLIDYQLFNGGYAYTTNANIYVSQQTLVVNSVAGAYSIYDDAYFKPFDTITQSTANITYISANGTLTTGSNVYTYFANSTQKGVGIINDVRALNSSAGAITVSPISGNVVDNTFYTVSNTIGAFVNVISGVSWNNASARVLEVSNTITIFTDMNGFFSVGDTIVQENDITIATAVGTVKTVSNIGPQDALTVDMVDGKFVQGIPAEKLSLVDQSVTTGGGNVVSVALTVALINVTPTFIIVPYNLLIGPQTNGMISFASGGTGTSLSISNNLLYSEVVSLNTDLISPYVNTAIAASTYGLPADPSGNLTSNTTAHLLSYANTTIGKISSINFSPGVAYTARPSVTIIEPLTYPYRKVDETITIDGATSNFFQGELVTQTATGARGLVRTANGTALDVERLRWEDANNFIATVNSTTTIIGDQSGAVANVISSLAFDPPPYLGHNANIVTTLAQSNGAIAGLQVIESGYGFVDGEEVVVSGDNQLLPAFANVFTTGTGRGFYQVQGGFLSDRKKIRDGYYYQSFSYDVRSSIVLDKYQQMLKKVVHTAGTKLFGTYVQATDLDSTSMFEPASITTS